jgi:hypothetical protein
MPFKVQSKTWPEDRALLLVHGVGDYRPGDYDRLKTALSDALGPDEWARFAIYEMFWDPISDWFQNRLGAADKFGRLLGALRGFFDASEAGRWCAEGVGDVIWPILVLDAREALRDACVLQIQQMIKDGRSKAGGRKPTPRPDMKLHVLCHSLGCFHAYEALSAAATSETLELSTRSTGIQFESVIFFASPVQLIRSAASALGGFVPRASRLFCLREQHLAIPGYQKANGQFIPYARRMLSITGDLDPVGGHLARRKLDWAYMNLIGTDRFVEHQEIGHLDTDMDLATLIRDSVAGNRRWTVTPNNPHDWIAYVEHNADRVRHWVLS